LHTWHYSCRLRDIAEAEKRKHEREEARNSLEGYVYRIRDLSGDETFVTASTAGERSKLAEKLGQTEDWLWAEGEKAPTKDLRSKRFELEYVPSCLSYDPILTTLGRRTGDSFCL
jgi:hypoxia up-regulated 1